MGYNPYLIDPFGHMIESIIHIDSFYITLGVIAIDSMQLV